jgi:hypothetical protein
MTPHEETPPEPADAASTPASPPPPDMRPTRGIDPPESGYGPPPAPDFGVITVQPADSPRPVVDVAAGPPSAQQGTPQEPPARPWALAAIVVPIVAVLALVIGLVVVGISSLLDLTGEPGEAAPSSESDGSGQSDPIPDPVAPGLGSATVESMLQAKIDKYKSARDNGSLWTTIPDSDYNRTALSAFLYLLTDLRLAASFGADTSDYLERANELEQKLLNQEPLGSNVTITLKDRTFTYDGDTGEGGYTDN